MEYRYMGSVLLVSVTHTRLRVSGNYPSSVCLAKLLSHAQRMPPAGDGTRRFGEHDIY
jgi:hypothetical protein